MHTSAEASARILSELQAFGARLSRGSSGAGRGAAGGEAVGRSGGAGPSDHRAVTLGSETIMVPVFNHAAERSPYELREDLAGSGATLLKHGEKLARVSFVAAPRFYALSTAEGVPYHHIATLHSRDVLATTLLQHCVRYGNRSTSCQFCAIGQSLAQGRTIAKKSPAQLAEVAEAAVRLDGVRHMVMTTGTPPTSDRGAQVLAEAARAVSARVALPIQAQCEPPDDYDWFARLHDAGVSTLGMHLEAVTEPVRRRIMPGKAEVSLAVYYEAFARAVEVFGRGQVTTYILAGLGDDADSIVSSAARLAELGVYPFVVPFVPIAGTPLEHHPTPGPAFMADVLARVSEVLAGAGLRSHDVKAGCARCGACSTLRAREEAPC
jgi:radical SAM protein (TIGR04043 family)